MLTTSPKEGWVLPDHSALLPCNNRGLVQGSYWPWHCCANNLLLPSFDPAIRVGGGPAVVRGRARIACDSICLVLSSRFCLIDALLRHEQAVDLLYYDDISFSVLELQDKRIINVRWFGLAAQQEAATHPVLVPKGGNVCDVLEQLAQLAQQGRLRLETQRRQLRMVSVSHHAIRKIYLPTEPIACIPDVHNHSVRCEEVPDEELDAPEGSLPVCIVRYGMLRRIGGGSYPARFGEPFFLSVGKAETIAQVRQRIGSRWNERCLRPVDAAGLAGLRSLALVSVAPMRDPMLLLPMQLY